MGLSTQEEKILQGIPLGKRAEVMSAYLIGMGGRKYNMSELGVQFFGGENYSQYVSLITRAYSFAGQNSGKYRSGCAFERKYNHRVTEQDIYGFVNAYPEGSAAYGVTFEDYMLQNGVGRSQSVQPQRAQESSGYDRDYTTMDRDTGHVQIPLYGGDDRTSFDWHAFWSQFHMSDVVVLAVLILSVAACRLILGFGWIISIIIGIVVSTLCESLLRGRR